MLCQRFISGCYNKSGGSAVQSVCNSSIKARVSNELIARREERLVVFASLARREERLVVFASAGVPVHSDSLSLVCKSSDLQDETPVDLTRALLFCATASQREI